MVEIKLPLEQWQQVLSILARAPWSEANPLIMAIGDQARAAVQASAPAAAPAHRGNGVDAEAETERR